MKDGLKELIGIVGQLSTNLLYITRCLAIS